jgi:hypothetical protein
MLLRHTELLLHVRLYDRPLLREVLLRLGQSNFAYA